jgi:L(+)-tartrate dehydratase beta subunit
MATYDLQLPLKEEDVTKLKIGDMVYLTGPAFTCRSMLQKKVLDEGEPMTVDPKKYNVLFHTGPIMKQCEDGHWKIMGFMPTSSIRFEKWTPLAIQKWGLRMILGKTSVGPASTEVMKKFKCVHIAPQSVSPNDWIDCIDVEGVDRIEEMGKTEATWRLNCRKLGPFVVDVDCEGNHLFNQNLDNIIANRDKAYEKLGIPKNFTYTKLYGFPEDF